MGDHFCLKWNNHQENLTGIMTKLLDEQKFVDVSLVCEQKTFKAHQTVLSACSPYFEQVLEENPHPHPIIILRDVKETEMTALLQYMYRGEVSVRDDELSAFLHTARALKVRGLSENKKETMTAQSKEDVQSSNAQSETVTPPKRPRTSVKVNELEVADKHHSESQSLSLSPNISKSSPKASSTTPVPPSNYSENSSEMHYTAASTPTQSIKQEIESISVPSEETSAISHLANLESRSEQCHKLGDWSFDYGHTLENRNYQTQKVELPKVPIPMTYNFSSQLQGTSIPGLYPCNSKSKAKKDQPSTSYELKPKMEFAPGPSFSPNQPVSVIKNTESTESNSSSSGIQRKGGRFRPGWMENYSWLQYDECLNTMYCKTCRKWSSSVPDIRTSFVEGNGNFRLEIVNHHHKSKAHKLCMAKEEESIPRYEFVQYLNCLVKTTREEFLFRICNCTKENFYFSTILDHMQDSTPKAGFQAATTAYSKIQSSAASLNPTFTDPGGIDLIDGAKQWQIKYAFEKVEGSGFKCKICGQIKKHVRNHYLKHFPEHHECHLCRRTYTRKDNLNSHLKRDHLHRAKTPPDPYQRHKRLTKKLEDYQGLRCFTPDVYTQLKYPAGLHGGTIQPETVTAPIDLSLRPSSVPIQPQCPPIYDILPSLYNYFQS